MNITKKSSENNIQQSNSLASKKLYSSTIFKDIYISMTKITMNSYPLGKQSAKTSKD